MIVLFPSHTCFSVCFVLVSNAFNRANMKPLVCGSVVDDVLLIVALIVSVCEFRVWSLFCYARLSNLFSFCNHLAGKPRAGCFPVIVFLLPCGC